MNKKIRGVLIDAENKSAKIVSLEDSLMSYYEALHCTCIDIVERTIGPREKYFSIVCDDEGLLTDSPCLSAVSADLMPMLVGSLFITDSDLETGELVSLCKSDAIYVLDHVNAAIDSCGAVHPVLCHVGY